MRENFAILNLGWLHTWVLFYDIFSQKSSLFTYVILGVDLLDMPNVETIACKLSIKLCVLNLKC